MRNFRAFAVLSRLSRMFQTPLPQNAQNHKSKPRLRHKHNLYGCNAPVPHPYPQNTVQVTSSAKSDRLTKRLTDSQINQLSDYAII